MSACSLALLLLGATGSVVDAWRPRDVWRKSNKVAHLQQTGPMPEPSTSVPVTPVLREGDALHLCQCEDASVSVHGGLQCEKEGWFIYSFEAIGRWVCLARFVR